MGHTNVRVIGAGVGGGEQGKGRAQSRGFVRAADQLAANAAALVNLIDGQVGEVGAPRVVSQDPGNPDEMTVKASSKDDVGIPQHPLNGGGIVDRPAGGEGGAVQEVDEIGGRQLGFKGVGEEHAKG